MPSKSEAQRKMVFSKRSQYGSKSKTPKDWEWIWNDEYKKIEEAREKKYWIDDKGKSIEIPRTSYHKDHVENYDKAIKDGWIRVLITDGEAIHCVCDKIDNNSFLKLNKFIKDECDLHKLPVFVNEHNTNKLKVYKPMMKEEIDSINIYKPYFSLGTK